MIRLGMGLLLMILLVGCSDSETSESESAAVETPEEVVEVKTDAQYVEEFKSAINYETLIAGTENSSVTPVDVDGDAIPEMVLLVNEQINSVYMATYKWQDNEWVEVTKNVYESAMYVQLTFVEKLQYEQATKAAFVIGIDDAGAGNVFKSLDVYMFDEENAQVKKNVSFQLSTQYEDFNVVKDNTFSFESLEGEQIDYTFKDGELIDAKGNRFGALIDDELAALIGTTINDYYLSFTDTYDTALDKITEMADIRADAFFESCAYYDTFSFCNAGEGVGIFNIEILPTKKVTANELEAYFGEPIIIIDTPETAGNYFAEIVTENVMYGFEFDGPSADATLTKMKVAHYTE